MARGGGPVGGGLLAQLSPYQVGLCSLLAQFARGELRLAADAERCLFQLLLREATASGGLRRKSPAELRGELCEGGAPAVIWEAFAAGLRAVDSPDALFDVLHGLETSVARETSSPSPLHAGGVFGRYARRCALTFKDASFEATVQLYDAVRKYVDEIDLQESASPPDGASVPPTVNVDDAGARGPGINASQLNQLAQDLMRDLPISFGRVPFAMVSRALAALRGQLPFSDAVAFLRYMSSQQQRLADDASSCLRSFHEARQGRGVSELRAGWEVVPPEDGLPDLVQHTTLALAGMHCEMQHTGDALLAVGESIRAAQEASDGSCLCACLYMLGLILLQAGLTTRAIAMLRRCLRRAEVLGLPMLQSLCCMGIACTLSTRPGLAERRKRGLLWKEPAAKSHQEAQPGAALRTQGAVGGGGGGSAWASGGGATSSSARAFGFTAGGRGALAVGSAPGRGGLGTLAALLGRDGPEGGDCAGGGSTAPPGGGACRDALAHLVLASQLTVQAGACGETRPKLLLSQAEVARTFGLRALSLASSRLALDLYSEELPAEDRALALCQLASEAAGRSFAAASVPLLRAAAQQLPHAGHLWAHVVAPQLVHGLVRAGECAAASALLLQAAGAERAAPQAAAAAAAQRLRAAANALRAGQRQLLPAYRSARQAAERAARRGAPGEVCSNLLCLADLHLEARDPIGALSPCLRCLSAAEGAQMPEHRAGALVRLARAKLEMRDLVGALQLAEEVTPLLTAAGSAQLRADALMVQADALLEILVTARRRQDEAGVAKLLQEIRLILTKAVQELEPIAELNSLRQCHYLLARVCHELGDQAARDGHAGRFRRISEFLSGHGRVTWSGLGLPHERDGPSHAEDETPGRGAGHAAAEGGGAGPHGGTSHAATLTSARAAAAAGCPALAELLQLAERGHGAGPGGEDVGVGPPRVETAIGDVAVLYPIAATLGP